MFPAPRMEETVGSKEEKETVVSRRPCTMEVATFQPDRLARDWCEQSMCEGHRAIPRSPLARSCAEIVR